MTQLDSFETALLRELRQHVEERDSRPARRSRTRLLVSGLGVVAAAVTAAVVIPGLGVTTAYSVQEGNSGEVIVSVDRLEDADGLERALEEQGISADVTYVPDGGQCAPGRYDVIDRDLTGMVIGVGDQTFRVTLPPGAVRDGETFVIAASLVPLPATGDPDGDGIVDEGGARIWLQADVATGPVADCQVIPG